MPFRPVCTLYDADRKLRGTSRVYGWAFNPPST